MNTQYSSRGKRDDDSTKREPSAEEEKTANVQTVNFPAELMPRGGIVANALIHLDSWMIFLNAASPFATAGTSITATFASSMPMSESTELVSSYVVLVLLLSSFLFPLLFCVHDLLAMAARCNFSSTFFCASSRLFSFLLAPLFTPF